MNNLEGFCSVSENRVDLVWHLSRVMTAGDGDIECMHSAGEVQTEFYLAFCAGNTLFLFSGADVRNLIDWLITA